VAAVVALLAVVWLPIALESDLDGITSNRHLSTDQAAYARGPSAQAGTNLALVHAALTRIPAGASFSIVRGGRWGTASHPNPKNRFVWEAGESWTQYVLAPRLEVAPQQASWLLVRGGSPTTLGIANARQSWRFGEDWLVRLR
jgi:hypothetical protein